MRSVLTAGVTKRLNSGEIRYARVDYSGSTKDLEVRLSDTSARPANSLLTYNVDLASVPGGVNVFVGLPREPGTRMEITTFSSKNSGTLIRR